MMLDDLCEIASSYPLSGGLGRQQVGDLYDAGSGSSGSGLFLVVLVTRTFTSGGGATVSFELVSDGPGSLATDGTATVHFASGPLALSSLTAGRVVLCVQLPSQLTERYIGLLANVATASITVGEVSAFITPNPSRWRAHADNVT